MAKKKRPGQPVPAATAKVPEQPASKAAPVRAVTWRTAWPVLLLSVSFFLIDAYTAPDSIKGVTMLLMLAAIAAVLFRARVLQARLTWLVAAAAAFVVMNGVSTLYATSGKFALSEFLKVMAGFCLFLLVLAFERGQGEALGRGTATILESASALAGLFSIDLLSTHLLSGIFFFIMGMAGDDYFGITGVEAGVRMISIYGNPNVFAGCAGIGVLLSLGLATTARETKERRFHLACLAVNSLSFVLAFSMGATASICLAFLAYLLLEAGHKRGGTLVLMIETLVIALAAAFPIYLTAFDEWDGFQPIPLVCTVLACAALCAADGVFGKKAGEWFERHRKAVGVLLAGVLAVVVSFGALAVTITGGVALEKGEGLRRSSYPEPGTYTLTLNQDAPLNVRIESQNRRDTMMHTSTQLYSGPAEGAVFEVPEDSMVVYFNFSAPQAAYLEEASYQGENGGDSLKLGYKLLPGFIANRLQGLFANQNAIQRTVFFEDGLKLFQRSPVIGLGMGAFENGYASVQSFRYTTKYAHNHYIQTMLEIGVVGLLLFISVLAVSLIMVVKKRRQERYSPLTAALGAALVFMAGHAGVEVVFSASPYLPFAFGIFALISLCCGDALPFPQKGKKVSAWVWRGTAGFLAVYAILLGGNMYATGLTKNANYERLVTATRFDRFEYADYMITYVANAYVEEYPSLDVTEQAEKYAQRLEKLDSNIIPLYLAETYFSVGDSERAFRMLEKYTAYVAADPETWRKAFVLAMSNSDDSQQFKDSILSLEQDLKDWNAANMGDITLDPTIQAYLDLLKQ